MIIVHPHRVAAPLCDRRGYHTPCERGHESASVCDVWYPRHRASTTLSATVVARRSELECPLLQACDESPRHEQKKDDHRKDGQDAICRHERPTGRMS